MKSIRDFRLEKEINRRFCSTFYLAHQNVSEKAVYIEVVDVSGISALEKARIKQAYERIKALDHPHVVSIYDIFEHQTFLAIVTEPFAGSPLYAGLAPGEIDMDEFLRVAVVLSRTLGDIHGRGITHQSITPNAVLYDESKDLIKITGFGVSGLINRIHEDIYDQAVIKTVLPYMAPEQTGRMNRSVDYRADLYSLGILCYELLTGVVPFASEDPVEIIHAQIAIMPPPPVEKNPAVAETLSDIVMKLISKTVEDRYQSSYGVMHDFMECARQITENGSIGRFVIGSRDIAPGLHLPEKLFGREVEMRMLIDAFDRAARGGNEVFLVAGPPGIGKSTLINEIQKSVVARRANFISGKAERDKQDIPYYPIIQALENLAQKILCEPDAHIQAWKTAILQAVGAGSRMITDLVPAFSHIIGPQPNLAPTGTDLTHHRVSYIFKEFVNVCATRQHPLIIFVDDLQWADAASLGFIRMLSVEPEIQCLLIIGAYRDNGLDLLHPLIHWMNEMHQQGAVVNTVVLPPLPVPNVHQMVTGLLKREDPSSFGFAEMICRKTGGNPFFIRQFIKMLYEKNVLMLNPESGWMWDPGKVADIRVTDNVVDFIAAKVASLPDAIRETLKICACCGNRFNLEAVTAIASRTLEAAVAEITIAADRGMVFFEAGTGVFTHDRIREGIYQLISPDEKIRMHHRIGRYMLENTPPAQLDEAIEDIVNHFNMARDSITSVSEQCRAADLNRRAGEKAIASGAFESAYQYFKAGLGFIEKDHQSNGDAGSGWQTDYDLMLALYSGCAEAAYLNTDYDEMDRYTDEIIRRARTINDTIPARIVLLHSLMARNKLHSVIRSGLSVLNSLGVIFPGRPTKLHVLLAFLRIKRYLRGKSPEDFLDLPMNENPAIQAQVDLMATLTSTAFWTTPNLLPLIVFRLMRTFSSHGNTDFSPYVYAGYGFMLCALGDIDEGYSYGMMALELLKRMDNPKYKARTLMVFNTFIQHWKEHAPEKIPGLTEGYFSGLQQGDLEFAGHNLMVKDDNLYLIGTPLPEMDAELRKSKESLKKLGQVSDMHLVQILHQVVLNLQGHGLLPGRLSGESYDEEKMLDIHLAANDKTCLFHFYVNKLILNYLFGDDDQACRMSEQMMKYIDGARGIFFYPAAFFYDSLARLRSAGPGGRISKVKALLRAARNQKKMKKWAGHCPENYLHKYHLVEAEIARIKRRDRRAVELYKRAIEGARKNGFFQEAALACECMARFYLDRGIAEFAGACMTQARSLYADWGAHAKVRHLEENYQALLPAPLEPSAVDEIRDEAPSKGLSKGDRFDLSAMIKISQAISSEIHLDKLLIILMHLIMENSGAEKALLVLDREGRLVVDARSVAKTDEIDVLQSIPVEESEDLCTGVINYAKRTGAPLVLDDALENDRFSRDAYIRQHRIRSVLCLPLIRQRRTIGLIYLENNLTPNAFTPDRLEMITLLSTQAANCLENAIFFEAALEAEKQARKQQVQYQKLIETMNDGLAIIDPELHIAFVNPALCRMTGYAAEEIIGRPAIDFLDDQNQEKLEEEVSNWTDRDRHVFEVDVLGKNGRAISTIVSPKPIYDADGEFAGFLGIVTDVTDLKKAEKEKELAQTQLLQSQKLEAIGTLAGGIAHDFNNYLTTILGSIDLIQMKMDRPESLKKNLAHIRHAAESSAALTRQLLAFGRVQMLEMTPINLNRVVPVIEMMLKRLIGENIQLITRLSPDLKPVKADFGQMEQVIMNLAVNARDAMPDGGCLYLKTDNVVIDAAVAQRISDAAAGEFVRLTVEDTGSGMDNPTLEKIFDPFFSNKALGQGTGLGLSVVYGVVKQHQGWINVYSEPGRGTAFNIYLPVSAGAASDIQSDAGGETGIETCPYAGNQQRVLLIEDQPEVREVVNIALTESGYIVREAATLREAEALMAQEDENFDLLFSDVILPDGNGMEFAVKITGRNPEIKVLLSSGYTEEKSRPDTIAQKHFHFLQKPYPLTVMLETVNRILSGNHEIRRPPAISRS